jgi:RNA polymerase sigma-70 factor (ECF subfamily)
MSSRMEEPLALPRPISRGGGFSESDPALPGLLEACRTGDREAFSRLFAMYADFVYGLARHLARDESAAADAAQEVFLKLLTRLPQYRGDAPFRSWVARIVVNAVRDGKRSTSRLVSLEEREEAAALPSPRDEEEEAAMRFEAARVRAAVAKLPARHRVLIALRYAGGLSYEEIAAALDLSAGTVASRLSRAHRSLGRALSDGGEAER